MPYKASTTEDESESKSSVQESDSADEFFKVDKILNKRVVEGKTEYEVKWMGYSMKDSTWEPVESFENCPELITEFEKDLEAKSKESEHLNQSEQGQLEGKVQLEDKGSKTKGRTQMPQEEEFPIRIKFESGLKPERILGATIRLGEMLFIIKWADLNKADLVRAKVAKVLWPQTVIEFYESNFARRVDPLLHNNTIITL